MSSLSTQEALPLWGKPAAGVVPRSMILWITILYVGLFILRPWEMLFPVLASIRLERCAGIFMIACVGLGVGFRFRLDSQTSSVLAFTAAVGVCSLCAMNPQLAWEQFYIFLTIVVCYFIFVSVARDPYSLIFIIIAYIGFMECYLAKSLWEYHVHHFGHWSHGMRRFVGIESTYGSYNKIALTVVASLPFWLFLWQCRASITLEWPRSWRRCYTMCLLVYPVLGAWAVVLTKSRAGALTLCTFLVLWSLRKASLSKSIARIGLAAALVVLAFHAMPEDNQRRIRTIWDASAGTEGEEVSKQSRVDNFWVGLEIFRDRPWVGVGPRNFAEYRERYVDGLYLYPHNLGAQVLAETGVLGTAAFVAMLLAIFGNIRKTQRLAQGSRNPNLRILSEFAVACRNSFLLLLLEGFSSHTLFRYNWIWLAAFCALAAKFALECREREAVEEERMAQESPALSLEYAS